MAKISAHGREIGTVYFTTSAKRYMSDGKVLKNIGFENWFPQEQVFPEEERQYSATLRAVRHAYSKLEELEPERADRPEHVLFSAESKLYYLV